MASTPARPGEPCPDPSAHHHHNKQQQHHDKLSEQASTAALYATKPKDAHPPAGPLGADGKLSSASAAASLKYANPQQLPSFPSVGLAGADSANRAATLAKDYKMKDLWQPQMSSAGSKAALLAHRDGGKLDLWQASPSKAGNSAAVLAMRGAKPFELDRGYTPDGKEKALLAATLSVNRGRSGSLPTMQPAAYPDSQNSAKNALSAATASHRQSVHKGDGWDSDANQAARVKNLHVNPRYFTGTPDIDIDPDETKHQAALRASATSMAKQMYEYQNRTVLGPDLTGGLEGAGAAAARQQPDEKLDVKQEALRYIHLQDAAHKLAQERLAKIDKSSENARYREYYGYPDQQTSPKKGSRLSVRGRNRNRAGSEGEEDDSDDEQQARRIRHQMTQLNTGVSAVDEKKRSDDRARLLAAAERRVHNQMHDMDERVFADTGKVPPAMLEEWEEKARKRAQEDRELAARPENKGKTHIGGGKFIDQAEIDAIAAARLKPTLDEINETAERKRARDEELRLEKEEQEREKAAEKQRHREEKDEQKRIKNEEKAAHKQEKEEAKARKEEEKRIAREEQRKSREVAREPAAAVAADEAGDEEDREMQPEKHRSGIFGRVASKLRRDREAREAKKEEVATSEPKSAPHADAVVGAGVATAGGVAVAGHEHDTVEHTSEAPPATETVEPAQTATTAPTLQRVHTGSQNDPTAPIVQTPEKPNLERHISTLGHSDDDFSDDEDELEDTGAAEESDRRRDQDDSHLGLLAGGVGAAGTTGVGAYEMAEGSDEKLHPVGEQSQTIAESAPVVSTGDATGPAPHTIGPHESDIANIVDPRVKPDPELQRGATGGDATGPAPSTIGPHKTDTANILDPRVQPDLSLRGPREPEIEKGGERAVETQGKPHIVRDAAVVGGVGAAGVGAYEAKGDETGPAPNTIGPHSSDIANIVDPRVKPDPEKLGKQKEGTTAPVASGSAVAAADHSGAPAPSVKTGPDTPLPTQEEPAEEKKGIRGFFGKLRRRSSKPDSEPGKLKKTENYNKDEPKSESSNVLRKHEPANNARKEEVATGAAAGAATGVAASDFSSGPKTSIDTSTAGPKVSTDTSSALPKASIDSTAPKQSTDTNPASPTSVSSFKRGEGGLRNFSSASSTAGKSDTDSRGRRSYDKPVSAYLKAEFGLGDLSKGLKLEGRPEEEDDFQEARDHFDENLAPPPAFAAGGKSESPVRGTRFREEV
ncbi:treacle protein-like [Teratosphaeria destructans]|uniref:Treacle protein-like n=1 Tax=Teratosphaeria destructans TaxID=418781 RepID=A0A9W7SPJ6_9PEZI|nr:treacle protein-like [Teratosphaeria destructans]